MPLFRNKSEAIIGLSLAELFMLSIALFWLVPGDQTKMVPESELLAEQRALAQATAELNRVQAELERLRGFAWLNEEKYRSLDAGKVRAWVDQKLAAQKGGLDKPSCAEPKILLEVKVVDGVTTAIISPEVSAVALAELNRLCRIELTPGGDCSSEIRLKALWEALEAYYRDHDCRFYYRPSYRTDSDYMRAAGPQSPFRNGLLYILRERPI